MFAHFTYGLIHAMLCLETVKAFELDELYRQDDWVRRWIMYWISNRDVLPQEVLRAWQLFGDDSVDKGLLELAIHKATTSWDKESLYFLGGAGRLDHGDRSW